MTMPIDFVLVRHGESEQNVANRASRQGDNRHFAVKGFRNRHASKFRLSLKGRQQAIATGQWLAQNFCRPYGFNRYYTSNYVRAMETSALLDLENAVWYREDALREREWGIQMDNMPEDERLEKYAEVMAKKNVEPYYWAPPGGESIANVGQRLKSVLDTLHRECSDKRVISVCHGEVIWAFRVLLERMPEEQYIKLHFSGHSYDHVHNGQVIHYSRINPYTGEMSNHIGWMRSVLPSDMSLSSNEWTEIVRPKWTNEQLLAIAEKTPQLIEG